MTYSSPNNAFFGFKIKNSWCLMACLNQVLHCCLLNIGYYVGRYLVSESIPCEFRTTFQHRDAFVSIKGSCFQIPIQQSWSTYLTILYLFCVSFLCIWVLSVCLIVFPHGWIHGLKFTDNYLLVVVFSLLCYCFVYYHYGVIVWDRVWINVW